MRPSQKALGIISFLKHIFKSEKPSPPPVVKTITELPKFTSAGNLLNVSLPEHTPLGIRTGNLAAVDGDTSGITITPKLLGNTTYQQLHSSSPVSLMLSGKGGNFSVIEVKNGPWTIMRGQNVITWTGFDFGLEAVALSSKMESFRTTGEGSIVLDARCQLYEMELQPGEVVEMNPNAFVATSVRRVEFDTLKNTTWAQVKLHLLLQKVRALSKKAVGKFPQTMSIPEKYTATPRKYMLGALVHLSGVVRWCQIHLVKRKPIMARLEGPGRVLFDNSCQVSNRVLFSAEEIYRIAKGNDK